MNCPNCGRELRIGGKCGCRSAAKAPSSVFVDSVTGLPLAMPAPAAFATIVNLLRTPYVTVDLGTFRVLVLGALKAEAISASRAAELLGVGVEEIRRIAGETLHDVAIPGEP